MVSWPGLGTAQPQLVQKISQMFLGIGLTSSVMLRWTLVPMKNLETYQKVQHKFSLWCEILNFENCHFLRYCTFKISTFCICVRINHYALCLQRLLCIDNALFHGTRFSTHSVLGMKNWISQQTLQYYAIFPLFIQKFGFFSGLFFICYGYINLGLFQNMLGVRYIFVHTLN